MTTTHPYAGTNSERARVGDPGHCERCAEVGHVTAHPDLGCGDVGCTQGHGPEDEPEWPPVDRDAWIDDQVREIRHDNAMRDLCSALSIGDRALGDAQRVVAELIGSGCYDIELAEGDAGPDLCHELDVAARALRNAGRVVRMRQALLDAESALGSGSR